MNMTILIIKSYLSILLPIGIGSLLLFIVGTYWICQKRPTPKSASSNTKEDPALHEPPADVTAIAGDDIVTTQLDLARAYIETGKNILAKQILKSVLLKGSPAQQDEAQHLLKIIL